MMNEQCVLIVDDEPQVASLIAEELSEHGCVCHVAQDAEEARALLGQVSPDVLLTDIQLAGITGLDLLDYTRKHLPSCKVILITGGSKREYLSQALLLGAYDYIEKPLKMADLVGVVSKALNGEGNVPVLLDRAAEAMELSARTSKAALESVTALVRAVEAKDPYTRRHSDQVAQYATHIARGMGLAQAAVESINIAALLHDIGKIGVPDHILTKPGPLTDQEFEYIRRHPGLGADILASITLFGHEAQLVRAHHERWDGKGYPDGLAGEEIPLPSRIIQIADCIDAMLMERTYKRGYAVEKMLGELVRCAGMQFDPRIATVAMQWCRSNPDKLLLAGEPVAREALSA